MLDNDKRKGARETHSAAAIRPRCSKQLFSPCKGIPSLPTPSLLLILEWAPIKAQTTQEKKTIYGYYLKTQNHP